MRISSETLISVCAASVVVVLLGFYMRTSFKHEYETRTGSVIETALNIVSNGPLAIPDVIVTDVNSVEYPLPTVLGAGRLLIYIPDMNCVSCAQKGLEALDLVFSREDTLRNNVLIISHFNNIRHQRNIQKQYNIQIFSLDEGCCFPSEKYFNTAVAMLCDSSLRAPSYMSEDVQVKPFDGWQFYFKATHAHFSCSQY